MSEKVAVVVTDSDNETAPALAAKRFGFEMAVLRYPSIEAIAQRVPDLILFDWSPSAVEKNTALVREIRSAPAIRDVPIFIFYSFEVDVPKAVRSTDRVVSFQIPVGPDAVERALRRFVEGPAPNTPAHAGGPPPATSQPRVFVGHGQSPVWRELKDFLEQRLPLAVVEFNRESVAGVATTERLLQMLSEARFAFLVFTADDLGHDGLMHARENVVHEAGLFQGRLGFKRAIILLEDGCQEFSNIFGLGQIRFPAGTISSAYEEIRRVLEREGIIGSS
jgi:predicted nucleotide-binding protein